MRGNSTGCASGSGETGAWKIGLINARVCALRLKRSGKRKNKLLSPCRLIACGPRVVNWPLKKTFTDLWYHFPGFDLNLNLTPSQNKENSGNRENCQTRVQPNKAQNPLISWRGKPAADPRTRCIIFQFLLHCRSGIKEGFVTFEIWQELLEDKHPDRIRAVFDRV